MTRKQFERDFHKLLEAFVGDPDNSNDSNNRFYQPPLEVAQRITYKVIREGV